MSELMPEKEQSNETRGELAFQAFCAVVFLTMIGLVFYNALLRYVFKSSFAPSEEWARFLFMYITFFGAIEAFYRGRHISVDMLTSMLHGATRKSVDILAQVLALGAMSVLVIGGITLVAQTMDTKTVATGLNRKALRSSRTRPGTSTSSTSCRRTRSTRRRAPSRAKSSP